jgi:hypothetical protein
MPQPGASDLKVTGRWYDVLAHDTHSVV